LLKEQQATGLLNANSLVYLDPPYFGQGRRLYYRYFVEADHRRLADFLHKSARLRWLISYDDVSLIRTIYSGEKNVLFMNYFVHTARVGRELVIGSADCQIPEAYFAFSSSHRPLTRRVAASTRSV